jgi:hypothetical protein
VRKEANDLLWRARDVYSTSDIKVLVYQCLGVFNDVFQLHMIVSIDRIVI